MVRPGGFMFNGFVGFIFILIGNILKLVGKSGLAGSGIILDPQKEREDLEAFSQAKGGMFADGFDEFEKETGVNINNKLKEKIIIRCQNCKTLNVESAKFCNNCGKPL